MLTYVTKLCGVWQEAYILPDVIQIFLGLSEQLRPSSCRDASSLFRFSPDNSDSETIKIFHLDP